MFATIYQLSNECGMLVVRFPRLDIPDTQLLDDLGLPVASEVATSRLSSVIGRVWRRILDAAAFHPTTVVP